MTDAYDLLLAVARSAQVLTEETDEDFVVQPRDFQRLCDALEALGFDPCTDDGRR